LRYSRQGHIWVVPAIIALLSFTISVVGNLVATDLDQPLRPYRLSVWLIFVAAILLTIALYMPSRKQRALPPGEVIRIYLEHVRAQNEVLTFPGLSREIGLKDIYRPTHVSLEPDAGGGTVQSDSISVDVESRLARGDIVPWDEVQSLATGWLLVGIAGSGKSTLVQIETERAARLGLQASGRSQDAKPALVPVTFSATDMVSGLATGKGLLEVVHERVAAIMLVACGLRPDDDTLAELRAAASTKASYLVLVDGLDELRD